jgi:cytochrome c
MSTRRTIAAATALLALGFGVAAQTPATRAARQPVPPSRPTAPVGPDLGVPATPAETAAADISVGPDGAGLPPGSGTPKQGAEVYAAKCVACHGADGANGINDRLVSGRGGRGTLTSPSPVKTIGSYWPYATTIFDYERRAMPYPAPHSLTDNETYAITAYVLHLNGIIGPDDVMDAASLPKVRMPNRDGFVNRNGRGR